MDGDALDDLIVCNWRERISADDVVWHLGDIGRDWRRLEDLPGRKHLILAHASDRRPAIAKSNVFETIAETATIEHAGRQFFLIHNPDQPRPGPLAGVIHGHHHYDEPAYGHIAVCVDHLSWGPMKLDDLVAAAKS
jgi:calcineurin-like phosphoesterase family protein